jgi:hypothetical protein
VRYQFNVADAGAVSILTLRVNYGDGFVAFLNGTRVTGENDPTPLTWEAEAEEPHSDPLALAFQNLDITAFKNSLQDGPNVLAFHALNFGSTSSDMLLSCELVEGASGSGLGAGIPPSQPTSPPVNFGAIEYNPNAYDLDNNGETLKLEDASNSIIAEFRYNDALPWPTAPDGLGPSLVLIDPLSNPDPALAANWRSSTLSDGNPNESDATIFAGTAGADTDSNGLDDLLDYAFGHSPGQNDGVPVLVLAGGTVTITYTQNLAADDLTLTPEWSTDLLNWQPLGDNFDLFSQSVAGGRKTVVLISNPQLFPPSERLFFRLTAEL